MTSARAAWFVAGAVALVAAVVALAAAVVLSAPDARGPDFAGYGFATPGHYLRYAADPTTDPRRERRDVLTYSDSPSKPDPDEMVRSCRAARTFPVYALGERFAGNDLRDATVTCQVPDPPSRAGRVRPGGQAAADLYYGPCRESGRGCAPTLDVGNRPARAEPHSALHQPDVQFTHRHLTVDGRRAATWSDGGETVVQVYFPRTTVTVRGPDRLARRAAGRLEPVRRSPAG